MTPLPCKKKKKKLKLQQSEDLEPTTPGLETWSASYCLGISDKPHKLFKLQFLCPKISGDTGQAEFKGD
jgi:hypothetical protein